MVERLTAEKCKEIRGCIGALHAEIRHYHEMLGDGFIIGPWLLETIRKTSDPQWYARACWAIGCFTATPAEHIESGLKRGELRAVDFMENLYEVVVESSAFTRELAEAVAQSVISQFLIHEAERHRLRTGPDKRCDFHWCGKTYPMRGKEFGLLRQVWRSPGRTAKVLDIFRKVWQSHDEVGTKELDRVEGTVKRIRKKLQHTPVDINFSRPDETVSIAIHWPATDR
jgi:hypothetical protein